MASRVLRNQVMNFNQNKMTKKNEPVGIKGGRRVLGDLNGQRNVVQNLEKLKIKEKVPVKSVPVEDVEMETDEPEIIEVVASGWKLPQGVEDIDTKDLGNPQLCAEYATETFAYLRELEGRCVVRNMHLAGQQTNERMRAVLVDWLVEVQGQFKLLQETLHSTVDIIDRYMAVEGKNVGRSKLQLVGVSAMFLAAKIEEMYAPACNDFVYITDNAYTEDEIKATELKIVRALEFNLSQPVSLNFLRRFSKAGDVDVLQHNLAKFFLETCLLDYTLVPVPGSKLAAASLFLSLSLTEACLPREEAWSPTLAFYSGYSKEEVMPVVRKIASNVVKAAKAPTKLQAVRNKYKSGKFMKVADMNELKDDLMIELANSVKQ